MYKYKITKISNGALKYQFLKADNSRLTFAEFINLLKFCDEKFLKELKDALNDATTQLNSAYLGECIPVSSSSVNKQFEFVATKSESLNRISQDYSSFQEHFDESHDNHVCSFKNLGKDATLIVPIPKKNKDYKNISEFTKNSSDEQQKRFGKAVADKLSENLIAGTTKWLSTNGLGVHYLHVRVDKSPKYYSHGEYLVEKPEKVGTNRVLVEEIKKNIDKWDFKQLTTSLSADFIQNQGVKNGNEKKEIVLVHQSLRLEDLKYYNQGGDLVIDPQKMFKEEDFDKREGAEIEQVWNDFHEYDNFSREQFIEEINRLKEELRKMRMDRNANYSQELLSRSESKLERTQFLYDQKFSNNNNNNNNNNFLIILVISLVSLGLMSGLLAGGKLKKKKVG